MASPAPGEAAEQAEMQQHEAAIFAKLGGWTSIQLAVNLFYEKVLGDPLLAPYFEGISMDRLRKKQIMFMSFAFGGVSQFVGKQIAYAHRDMILNQGLNLTHYDAVAGHFVATLTELGVPGPLIAEAAGVVLTTRPYFDPKAVFEEVESFKAQVAAPVASTLMALQQELRGSQGQGTAGSNASKPTSPSPAAPGAAPVVPQGDAMQGDLGGGEERASCAASVQGSMERLRISTLAEVFSSQVLGEGHARAFAAAARSGVPSRADSRMGGGSSSGAAALSPPSQPQPSQEGITASELLSALADGNSSADLTASNTEAASTRAGTSTLSHAHSGSGGQGLSPAELEAKRLRRKMMKDILRGIGVLPGSSGSDPSTLAPASAPLPSRNNASTPSADGTLPAAPAPSSSAGPPAPKVDMMTVYRAASNSSPAGEERFSRGSHTGDLSSLMPSHGQLTPPASGGAGSDAGEGEGRQRLQQQLESLSKSSGKSLTAPGGASATVLAAASSEQAAHPAYAGQGPRSEGGSSSSSSSSGVSFVDESDHETPHEDDEEEDEGEEGGEHATSPALQPGRVGGAYGSPSQQRVTRRQGSKLELRTGSVPALDPVDELPEASTATH